MLEAPLSPDRPQVPERLTTSGCCRSCSCSCSCSVCPISVEVQLRSSPPGRGGRLFTVLLPQLLLDINQAVCSSSSSGVCLCPAPMALQQEGVLMIEVSIPSMEDKEVDESGKSKKLFRVEVLFNERKHYVLRRPSEFQTLHRKLKKIIQTPEFPSRRNLHLRTKPLGQRRQELEDYIQDIIYQNEDVPQVLLDFLHLKHFHTGNKISSTESLDELDSQEFNYELPHQRVLGFFQDPYLSEGSSGLPDIVVDGVLQGFYPREVRVSFNASTLPEYEPTPSVEA